MKGSDKFLIGIVVGIGLLIIVAFIVTLTRPEPTYQPEDSPEGVAHNYLLALQQEDYQRAYGYLSPQLQHYPPSAEAFTEDIEAETWRFRMDTNTTLAVESVNVTDNRAVVKVRESRFDRGNLFSGGQSSNVFEMELQFEEGQWKIVDSDYYFAWCWTHNDYCK